MNVGILGTGGVGRAIGSGFVTLGHAVKMGAQDDRNEKALAWAQEMGAKAAVGTFADAAFSGCSRRCARAIGIRPSSC